jgi:hypothetical protein
MLPVAIPLLRTPFPARRRRQNTVSRVAESVYLPIVPRPRCM